MYLNFFLNLSRRIRTQSFLIACSFSKIDPGLDLEKFVYFNYPARQIISLYNNYNNL